VITGSRMSQNMEVVTALFMSLRIGTPAG